MCWLHDTIHLATVTLQESREFGGFVKVGPKSSLRPFLHRALQLLNQINSDLPEVLYVSLLFPGRNLKAFQRFSDPHFFWWGGGL